MQKTDKLNEEALRECKPSFCHSDALVCAAGLARAVN
jgi:hypothetical protein